MIRRPLRPLVLASLLTVAGCMSAPPPSRSTVAARAACQARTEASYNRQNRALLSTRDTTDTPFSTSGNTSIPSAGLSREYDRLRSMDSCLAGSNAAPETGSGADGTAFQGASTRNPGLPAQ